MPAWLLRFVAQAIASKVLTAEHLIEVIHLLGQVVSSDAAGKVWVEVVRAADALHAHVEGHRDAPPPEWQIPISDGGSADDAGLPPATSNLDQTPVTLDDPSARGG